MKRHLTMDSAGRIVLPKPIRDQLGLKAGDALGIDVSEDQITLRPIYPEAHLVNKGGLWVMRGGPPMSLEDINQAIQRSRDERMRAILGESE
ncbi:MAG TPA: AbrB/MazE/SpoVT family DNA-binding domain-containing protein [Terriglobales bacterium]|jgi:AbrB family looped-hinge helix DNA binding protein